MIKKKKERDYAVTLGYISLQLFRSWFEFLLQAMLGESMSKINSP